MDIPPSAPTTSDPSYFRNFDPSKLVGAKPMQQLMPRADQLGKGPQIPAIDPSSSGILGNRRTPSRSVVPAGSYYGAAGPIKSNPGAGYNPTPQYKNLLAGSPMPNLSNPVNPPVLK